MSLLTGGRVAVDLQRIHAELATEIHDPEIGRPLGELGMLGEISARRGRVRVEVRLTTEDCPLVGELRHAVTTVAARTAGVASVDVEFTTMPPRERAELGERLGREATPLAGPMGGSTSIYAIASGKGGVGKSTVTVNLAAALAAAGQRVGVLDADVWGYSVPQLLGVRRSPVVLGERMLPVPAHGVGVMSVGFFVDEEQPVVWRGPMLHKALQQFVTDTHWGELDALLIDMPPGTGDATLSLLELLPDVVLIAVTTPQATARTVAARAVRMASDAGVAVGGIVENMSTAVCQGCGDHTPVFGTGGGALLADQTGAPLLGQVPLDQATLRAGERGIPVVVDDPGAESARALTRIATTLPTPRRSLVGRALPLSVVTR